MPCASPPAGEGERSEIAFGSGSDWEASDYDESIVVCWSSDEEEEDVDEEGGGVGEGGGLGCGGDCPPLPPWPLLMHMQLFRDGFLLTSAAGETGMKQIAGLTFGTLVAALRVCAQRCV